MKLENKIFRYLRRRAVTPEFPITNGTVWEWADELAKRIRKTQERKDYGGGRWNKMVLRKPGLKENVFIHNITDLWKLGWNPAIIYIHGFHESGGFKKVVGLNNYWGIKASKSWKGKKVRVVTHEFVKGKLIKVNHWFRDWDTCEEALSWYLSLIKRLYPESYGYRSNYKKFFVWLVKGKFRYATDKKYVIKLIKLYEELIGE